MGELEEQQHAELLQVVAIGEAVVAEHGAIAQSFWTMRLASLLMG